MYLAHGARLFFWLYSAKRGGKHNLNRPMAGVEGRCPFSGDELRRFSISDGKATSTPEALDI